MILLDTIENLPVLATFPKDIITGRWHGRIDDDGSGDPHGDPDFQARTSYHNYDPVTGVPRWLNADKVPYIVLPPQIIARVPGIVLGCWVEVFNEFTGKSCVALVGDVGPHVRIGEISIRCAQLIGVNPDPIRGGEDRPGIWYLVRPGVPAIIDGLGYALEKMALAS